MNQPNKAFKVYQASAGSGKTYTIVKEYLELCLKDEGSINNYSHILAITFTNMAANEMKAKILNHLSDIINSALDEEPKDMEKTLLDDLHIERNALKSNAKRLFQSIIHDYSSFCVSTIDAFFQQLSKSFAKELGLPTQFNTSILSSIQFWKTSIKSISTTRSTSLSPFLSTISSKSFSRKMLS